MSDTQQAADREKVAREQRYQSRFQPASSMVMARDRSDRRFTRGLETKSPEVPLSPAERAELNERMRRMGIQRTAHLADTTTPTAASSARTRGKIPTTRLISPAPSTSKAWSISSTAGRRTARTAPARSTPSRPSARTSSPTLRPPEKSARAAPTLLKAGQGEACGEMTSMTKSRSKCAGGRADDRPPFGS